MDALPGKERREFIRIEFELPVRYRFVSHHDEIEDSEDLQGYTGNISQNGLVLFAALPPDRFLAPILHKKVKVAMSLQVADIDPHRSLSAECRLAWLELDLIGESCEMGLEFIAINEEDRLALFKYALAASGKSRREWLF